MTHDRSLNHTKWACQYHVVFIPKYRKKAIYGRCAGIWARCSAAWPSTGKARPPKYLVVQVIGYIKGKRAIHIAREFASP